MCQPVVVMMSVWLEKVGVSGVWNLASASAAVSLYILKYKYAHICMCEDLHIKDQNTLLSSADRRNYSLFNNESSVLLIVSGSLLSNTFLTLQVPSECLLDHLGPLGTGTNHVPLDQ